MIETPVPVEAGTSPRRDRTWGLLGGVLGAAVGLGSASIAIFVGAAFAVTGIVLTRRSPYPRTDALGTLLVSGVLSVLGGGLLFTRLVAIINGA